MNTHVLVNEVKTTIVGHECGDLLAVLHQLHTDTLADGRVGLLGLDSDLLKDDSLGVGRASEGGRAENCAEGNLLPALVSPLGVAAGLTQLAGGVDSVWLSSSCFLHNEIILNIVTMGITAAKHNQSSMGIGFCGVGGQNGEED